MSEPRCPSPLALRLLAKRTEQGRSCRALSRDAGLSEAIVFHIERGYTQNPGVYTVERIAKVLGVEPEWLAWGNGARQ